MAGNKRGPEPNSRRVPMTEKRKATFLETLRRTGVFAAACRAASPHSKHRAACYSSFRNEMQRSPEFAAEVADALDEAKAEIELEIYRRGVEGWDEPVYQKGMRVIDHDGSPASIRRYSDNLLLTRAKAMMPEKYADRSKIEHSGVVNHDVRALTISPADLIALNSAERAVARHPLHNC